MSAKKYSINYILPILLFLVSPSSPASAQVHNEYTADGILSATIYRSEWNLSYPIIKLNSTEKLILKFDEAGGNIENYYYTFIHCDRQWNQSEIFVTDYLEGFAENPIENYSMSFNTTFNYIHYSVEFPNRDINFKYSGNYLIEVYRQGEPDNPVVIKRFMVSEGSVTIKPEAGRSRIGSFDQTHQQVDFTVSYPGMQISDPYRYVTATVLQNGRWDNAHKELHPNFLGNKQLVFNDISGKNIYPGGNEFRYFDIKSLRYHTENVRSVENFEGHYHVYLLPSEDRSYKQYFYWQDFNGKYYTAIQEGRDQDTEADYVYVYFTLPSKFPARDGDVYVFGGLSGWTIGDENRMRYNNNDHNYELTMLLKQGWYNYIYVVAGKDGIIKEDAEFESNHYETENDYTILIYLSEPSSRYDRILGDVTVNTLNGNPK